MRRFVILALFVKVLLLNQYAVIKKPEITFTFSGHLISCQYYLSFLLNACWSENVNKHGIDLVFVLYLFWENSPIQHAQYFSPARLAWNSLVCKAKMKQFSSLILSELIESKIIKSLCQKKSSRNYITLPAFLKCFFSFFLSFDLIFTRCSNKCSLNVPYNTHRTTQRNVFFFSVYKVEASKVIAITLSRILFK